MSSIKDADFLTTFPPALKQDESMVAIGQLIADELHITAEETKKNIIYANIEELSETWLDVLAYDLHVDWYDYNYPLEAKRAIIRDSVKVHQKLGTKAAVEMALGGIHPLSEIEEWFDYDGEPFHFRIVLDTTKSRVEADYDEIVKRVDIYKRLTAHLDGLYYQGSISVIIVPQTEYFLFSAPMTGQLKAGTHPRRNTVGAVADTVINIDAQAAGYTAEYVRTGTKPYRNIVLATQDGVIVTDSDTDSHKYTAGQTGAYKAGTKPYRNTAGGTGSGAVTAQTAGESFTFYSDLAGTKPGRNILFEAGDVTAAGEADVEAYVFESTFTGTQPERNVVFAGQEVEAVADTGTEEYSYDADMTGQTITGTEPYTSTTFSDSDKGMTTTADTESYQYGVKRCGSSRL